MKPIKQDAVIEVIKFEIMVTKNVLNKNILSRAKKELENHAQLGGQSGLSIQEVAELMDTVKGLKPYKSINSCNCNFGFSSN